MFNGQEDPPLLQQLKDLVSFGKIFLKSSGPFCLTRKKQEDNEERLSKILNNLHKLDCKWRISNNYPKIGKQSYKNNKEDFTEKKTSS